jgi:hypothetical protein
VTANVTLGDRAFARNADKPASMVIVDCRVDGSAPAAAATIFISRMDRTQLFVGAYSARLPNWTSRRPNLRPPI